MVKFLSVFVAMLLVSPCFAQCTAGVAIGKVHAVETKLNQATAELQDASGYLAQAHQYMLDCEAKLQALTAAGCAEFEDEYGESLYELGVSIGTLTGQIGQVASGTPYSIAVTQAKVNDLYTAYNTLPDPSDPEYQNAVNSICTNADTCQTEANTHYSNAAALVTPCVALRNSAYALFQTIDGLECGGGSSGGY